MDKITRGDVEDNHNYIFLNALFLCKMQLECMDRLRKTTYYRKNVKMATLPMVQALTTVFKEDYLTSLIGYTDECNKMELTKYIDDFIIQVCSMSTEYFGVLAEIIKMLKDNPEDVMGKLEIVLLDKIQEQEVVAL